jgi:hypothetical protein
MSDDAPKLDQLKLIPQVFFDLILDGYIGELNRFAARCSH